MNQLEKDLDNKLREKLQKWIEDCFDLYEMADLGRHRAYATIMEMMYTYLGIIASCGTIDELELCSRLLAAYRASRARLEKEPEWQKWIKKEGPHGKPRGH
jgi:hypothetical protein